MRKWAWVVLTLILVAALFSIVLAQTGQFDLPWHTIDSGGGESSGGDFAIQAAVGQPDASSMSGGDFTMSGGFLVAPISPDTGAIDVFLPLLRG